MTRLAPADVVHLVLPSHPKFLPLVRAVVEQGARVAGFDETTSDGIVLAAVEGVTNVMRHGYGGSTDRQIDLTLHAPAGLFRLEIADYGTFVDPARIQSRPLDEVRPGGLGVHLMKSVMDDVRYEKNAHGGTTLTLLKRLTPGTATENAAGCEESS